MLRFKIMHRSLLIAVTEVRTFLRDRADLAFSLLLPIAIFALMYGAFGTTSQFQGTAHIVNEDKDGMYANRLLEKLSILGNLRVKLYSKTEAETKLARSDLVMVLYIPEDFSAKLSKGEQAKLIFKQRGNGGQAGQIVASMIRGATEEIAQEIQVLNQVGSALESEEITQDLIKTTVQKFLKREQSHPVIEVKTKTAGSSPDIVGFMIPGIITMFVLFAVSLGARTLVDERRRGTMERLLTTQLKIGELFAGKFFASVGRGFVQVSILLILSFVVFRSWTAVSFLETLIICILFIAAVSGLGLLIGSIARTEDQAVWIAVVFTMVMTMFGGTFFEISKGSVLYTLSRASINMYANESLKMIITSSGTLPDTGFNQLVLAGVAILSLFLGRIFFKVMPGGR